MKRFLKTLLCWRNRKLDCLFYAYLVSSGDDGIILNEFFSRVKVIFSLWNKTCKSVFG